MSEREGFEPMDRVNKLVQDYWTAANERGPHLEAFIQSVTSEDRGADAASPEEIEQFLRIVQERIIDNIETKAGAGGPWAMMKAQVIADTEAEIEGLGPLVNCRQQ